MSKLPRAPASSIRPPKSGLAMPNGIQGFLDEAPTLPAFTQRIAPGARRATLTTTTFTPPASTAATIARSSGLSAARMGGGATSPSPSASSDSQASLTLRAPSSMVLRDGTKSGTISRNSPIITSTGNSELADEQAARGASQMHTPASRTPRGPREPGPSNDARPAPSAELRIGAAVVIPTQGLKGTLRYLGPIVGKQGAWAGVELDEAGTGKNNGTVAGKSYFSCPPNTGIFVAPSKIKPCVQQQQQQQPGAGASNNAIPPISSVLSSGSETPQPNKQLGLGSRAGSRVATPGTVKYTHGRQSSRSRVNRTPSGLSSPVSNRRKTLTRAADSSAAPSRVRPPPAAKNARPLSTAGSVTSNRTSSPSRSRPSSRTLVSGTNDADTHNFSRTPARLSAPSGATSPESRPAGVLANRRRVSGLPPGNGLVTKSSGVRSKPVLATDSADRLKMRIDMLEAENRMLRLKSEQDKAQIAASQMLAKDLAASPSARSAAGPADAREALERERKADKAKIDQLQAHIRELEAHASSSVSADDSALAQLQTELHTAAKVHASELELAKNAHSETAGRLGASEAAVSELQSKLESKTNQVAILNDRLEQKSLELSRAIERYQEFVDEREHKQAEELESIMEKQVEKLRRELADSESQRLALTAELEAAATAQSVAAAKIADLNQQIKSTANHSHITELLSQCRQQLLQIAEEMSKDSEVSGDLAGLADSNVLEAVPVLLQKTQQLAAQTTDCLHQAVERVDTLTDDIKTRDAQISELQDQLALAQTNEKSPSQQNDRLEELELQNAALLAEREQFTSENSVLTDYLGKLESECNRLVDDIEQLNTENQKLAEELRVASMQNSMASLDFGTVDGSAPTDDPDMHQKHSHEIVALKLQLEDTVKRKDQEIARLQEELASLENIVEDKIFKEEELNDRISSLANELDKLRSGNSVAAVQKPEELAAPVNGDIAIDETYCEICESGDHDIADCPAVTSTTPIFKQETPDSSRPYCDNCESFCGHWTEDCPHSDEMF
ncbi:hypothetical protein LPJ55_004718 [Coemansia sp. RSA 990]|nr:hypothetical protein LPJ55_004718 [Coemansia sp. RSA 990]